MVIGRRVVGVVMIVVRRINGRVGMIVRQRVGVIVGEKKFMTELA